MTVRPSRRAFLVTGTAAMGATLLPAPARALSTGAAQQLVQSMVAEINQVIASGLPESQMISRFAGIFDRYADGPTVAIYALGAAGRAATPDQRARFQAAFRNYVAVKYGSRFREFIGGEIAVEAARPVNDFIEVQTTAYLRGEDPFRVDFHVSDRSGQPKFFNLIIEGVNMLLSERTEIGAMLDRRGGNIDALIADLG